MPFLFAMATPDWHRSEQLESPLGVASRVARRPAPPSPAPPRALEQSPDAHSDTASHARAAVARLYAHARQPVSARAAALNSPI